MFEFVGYYFIRKSLKIGALTKLPPCRSLGKNNGFPIKQPNMFLDSIQDKKGDFME